MSDVSEPAGREGCRGSLPRARVSPLAAVTIGLMVLGSVFTLAPGAVRSVHGAPGSSWTLSGTVEEPLGPALDLAGDFDGDGRRDLVLAASDGQRVEIYRGLPGGWTSEPTWVLHSPDLSLEFGASLAARGDHDGDGRSDLAVGAPAALGSPKRGAVWVYRDFDCPPLELRSSGTGDRFGDAVAWIDCDGDGLEELFVGSPTHTGPSNLCGRVDWFGPAGSSLALTPVRSFFGSLAGDAFGSTVISAGDLNGDGAEELLIGAPDASRGQNREGLVLLYPGSGAGPGLDPIWRAQGNQDFGYFGYAATPAGDTDGNGAAEVLISGWGMAQSRGQARLYEWKLPDLSAAELVDSLQGARTIDFLGISLVGAVDLDGDGHSDCGVGIAGADGGGPGSGEVLWLSRASGQFVELCRVEGETGEQLGTVVAVGTDRTGLASFAASAPWSYVDGVRVGRALAWPSDSPAGLAVPVRVGWDRPRLLLRGNPVTRLSRLDLWGREGEPVELRFTDPGGRHFRSLWIELPGGHRTLPFWGSDAILPRTGWVSIRQGGEVASARWVRRWDARP